VFKLNLLRNKISILGILADVQLLEEMNVTIDWTDELLFVKQYVTVHF
jgi:hypothetical protein